MALKLLMNFSIFPTQHQVFSANEQKETSGRSSSSKIGLGDKSSRTRRLVGVWTRYITLILFSYRLLYDIYPRTLFLFAIHPT